MGKKLTFIADVRDGRIKMAYDRFHSEVINRFSGRIKITVQEDETPIHYTDHIYYRKCMLPMVVEGLIDVGYGFQSDNKDHVQWIHDWLKKKFGPAGYSFTLPDGSVHEVIPSMSDYKEKETKQFFFKVQKWAKEFINTDIPSKGEQINLKL